MERYIGRGLPRDWIANPVRSYPIQDDPVKVQYLKSAIQYRSSPTAWDWIHEIWAAGAVVPIGKTHYLLGDGTTLYSRHVVGAKNRDFAHPSAYNPLLLAYKRI